MVFFGRMIHEYMVDQYKKSHPPDKEQEPEPDKEPEPNEEAHPEPKQKNDLDEPEENTERVSLPNWLNISKVEQNVIILKEKPAEPEPVPVQQEEETPTAHEESIPPPTTTIHEETATAVVAPTSPPTVEKKITNVAKAWFYNCEHYHFETVESEEECKDVCKRLEGVKKHRCKKIYAIDSTYGPYGCYSNLYKKGQMIWNRQKKSKVGCTQDMKCFCKKTNGHHHAVAKPSKPSKPSKPKPKQPSKSKPKQPSKSKADPKS
jgi:hypothetical protein